MEVILRIIGHWRGKRGVKLAPYLFLFYKSQSVLSKQERILLSTHESYVRHGIKTEDSMGEEETCSEPGTDTQTSDSEDKGMMRKKRLGRKATMPPDYSLFIPKSKGVSVTNSPGSRLSTPTLTLSQTRTS